MEHSTIIKTLKTGDTTAINAMKAKIFHLHKNYVMKMLPPNTEAWLSKEDLNDIYVDTLTVVFENIDSGTFKGESSLKTYLLSIFKRKCIDAYRKKTTNKNRPNRTILDVEEAASHLPTQVQAEISRILIAKDCLELVLNELNNLGEPCNTLLRLLGEGISYEEIGQKMNYSSGPVVRTTAARCRATLKKNLGNSPCFKL